MSEENLYIKLAEYDDVVEANKDCHATGRVILPELYDKQRDISAAKRHAMVRWGRRGGKTRELGEQHGSRSAESALEGIRGRENAS